MIEVCIVIPIYKEKPTDWEIASFRQVLKVLSRYDIFIYTYQGVDLSIYTSEATNLNKNFNVEYFNQEYFSSVKGYNRLCLSVDFYRRVSKYEYMLIYQLDAWVFRDELEFWCNKEYDYIGAPILTNFHSEPNCEKLWVVGNGGFSLRKISFFIGLLTYKLPISCRIDINNGFFAFFKSILKSIGVRNTISWYIKHVCEWLNEDVFFTLYISSISNRLKLIPRTPKLLDAFSFSFECSPSHCYSVVNKLPFGCHAFEKYEFETFWKKYIIQ